MKAPVISIATPAQSYANSITEIGIAPTTAVSGDAEPLYDFNMRVSIHESNSGTGNRESCPTFLSGGSQTLSQAAARLAIMTMGRNKMMYDPSLQIKSAPPRSLFTRAPSGLVDETDAERELKRKDREADEAVNSVAIPKLQKLLQMSQKLLQEYPTLAKDPQRLAQATNGYLIAKTERDAFEMTVPRAQPSARHRPAPRM